MNATINNKINNAKTLQELADVLNNMVEGEQHEVDFSELPKFGGRDIENTSQVWSWDKENILVQNSDFDVEPRCLKCGEALFHCNHDED